MMWKERLARFPVAAKKTFVVVKGGLAGHLSNPATRRGIFLTCLVLIFLFSLWKGLSRVREGDVGVIVNNLTGAITVETREGYRMMVPWMYSFYRLDRRVQTLVMADRPGDGFRGGDSVKIKDKDGSDVSMDINVTYRILPAKADKVIRNSGPDLSFSELWIRSAVRAMMAQEFGQLTTEQIYDSTLRNERSAAVLNNLNDLLEAHGLEIVAVVPYEFRFYQEYEEIIRTKKLADQEVEEQRSQARLAQEEQSRQIAQADFVKNQQLLLAEGEADRIRAEADGYLIRTRLEAEGALITNRNRAQAIEATGMAEAQGMGEQIAALSGAGGVNLVALEYAKQLGKINFTGVPVVQEGRVGQYRLHPGVAGSGGH